MAYDWRDRQVATKQGALVTTTNNGGSKFQAQVQASVQTLYFDVGHEGGSSDTNTQRPITYDVLNNQNDVTTEDVYAGNGDSVANIVPGYASDATPDPNSLLRSQTVSHYNADEIDYEDDDDPVDQSDGTKTDNDPDEDTQTLYDNNGNVVTTIDPNGNVTATTFDDNDNDIADYKGQAVSSSDDEATFTNLTPTYTTAYDVYVQAGPDVDTTGGDYPLLQGSTITDFGSNDPLRPTIDGWAFLGTVDFNSSLPSSLTVGGADNPAGTKICVLQQTSATNYDGDGNVTATIDGDGNVTATSYDKADRDVADYTGQVIDGNSVTFKNLTNYQGSYDIYVQGGSLVSPTAAGSDATHPDLGDGWTYKGTITVPPGTGSLPVAGLSGSSGTTAICLLQLATSTAYDANGNVTATIDGSGRVTATTFDALDEDIADYQGQAGSSGTTFTNLSPNVSHSYDIFTAGGVRRPRPSRPRHNKIQRLLRLAAI